jgi:hypothetical protein
MGGTGSALEVLFALEPANVLQRRVDSFDGSACDAAGEVALAEEAKILEIRGGLERPTRARAVVEVVMMFDQPECPIRHRTSQGINPGFDVVGGINRLADVMQQGRQQEFFVVRADLAGDFEHLEAVIECIPLGMLLRALLDRLKRDQSELVDGERVEVIRHPPDVFRFRLLRYFEPNLSGAEESDCFLSDLTVAGQVARPHGTTEHGCGLALGGVEVGLRQGAKPVRPFVGTPRDQPARGLECDLTSNPVIGARCTAVFLVFVVHGMVRLAESTSSGLLR